MAWLGTNSNSLRGSDNLFKCGELDHWPFDLQITLLFIYATRKTSTKLELLRFSIVWVTSYKLFCVSTSRGSDLDRWAFGLKLQYNLHVHKYLCNNLNFLQLFVLEIRTYQECHMFLPPPPWTTGWNLCWRMQRQRYGRGPDAAAATGVPYVSFPVKTPRPMKNFHLWN